jgi:hypothetical protein
MKSVIYEYTIRLSCVTTYKHNIMGLAKCDVRPALSAAWSYIEKCCGSCERNLIRRARRRIDHHCTGPPKHRLPSRGPSRRRVLLLCCWIKSFRTGKNDKQVTSITRRISREWGHFQLPVNRRFSANLVLLSSRNVSSVACSN